MAVLVTVRYWRDPTTLDVMREETYDDGTITHPMPDGAALATEQEYFVGLGTGDDEIQGWIQRGLQVAGQG